MSTFNLPSWFSNTQASGSLQRPLFNAGPTPAQGMAPIDGSSGAFMMDPTQDYYRQQLDLDKMKQAYEEQKAMMNSIMGIGSAITGPLTNDINNTLPYTQHYSEVPQAYRAMQPMTSSFMQPNNQAQSWRMK